MTPTRPSTGVDDTTYDLVLVFQQALEDCYRYQRFARDAQEAGDREVEHLFTELAESDRDIAARVSRLLVARLTKGAPSDER